MPDGCHRFGEAVYWGPSVPCGANRHWALNKEKHIFYAAEKPKEKLDRSKAIVVSELGRAGLFHRRCFRIRRCMLS